MTPLPLHMQIIAVIGRHPAGISTADIAAQLGRAAAQISSIVSKMSQYGAPVERVGKRFGPGVRWRLKPEAETAP